MSDDARIDVAKLRRVILEHAGQGRRFTRRSLSLAASNKKNPDLVRDIFRVDDRKPTFDTVAGIARALDMDVTEFLVGSGAKPLPFGSTVMVPVIGAVEAGAWRESWEFPADEVVEVEFAHDGVTGDRIGLQVEGRSMDRRFPPGTTLDCVKLIGSDESVEDGDYVIVESLRGGLVEATCKRLIVADDGSFSLVGESTLPEYEVPIPIGKPDQAFDGDAETRIVARVIHARQTFVRRKRLMTISG
jgi:SOS-response transcriptional repressor LexA